MGAMGDGAVKPLVITNVSVRYYEKYISVKVTIALDLKNFTFSCIGC